MNARQAVRAALIAVLLLPVAATARAQRASRRCVAPDTSADWFRKQREWLSDVRHDWSDDAFRNSLLSAAGITAGSPLAPELGAQGESEVASANADTTILEQLRSLAQTRGSTWPTRTVVGAAGVRAVWMLAQRDTALERTALHRMMESGPDEALPADVAVLEDRVRLLSGRKQLYGSQLRMVNGKLVPAPIEDSAHVDMRRDAAGLPPLNRAICTLR